MLRILLISAGAILETLFIMRSYRRRDGMSVFLKTAASLVFVLLGLLELRRTGTSVYGELVVAGLTLGMLGDLLLALRYLGQKLHHFFFAAGADALSSISFSAAPGQTIGVIGGTGAGKSTLANLIPRFYDATQGQVLVCGEDVRQLRLQALRPSIGVVPQKALLFSGTIRDNLRWGNAQASDEDLWQALQDAQADQVVRGKQGGLDAEVEPGGRNFSGGQRQRLTIARALVRRPAILILDDSASALDFATDAALRKALAHLPWKPTVVLISQRVSSIRHADQILVLDDGRLAGTGTHDELLQSCPVYQEICRSQYKKEDAQ